MPEDAAKMRQLRAVVSALRSTLPLALQGTEERQPRDWAAGAGDERPLGTVHGQDLGGAHPLLTKFPCQGILVCIWRQYSGVPGQKMPGQRTGGPYGEMDALSDLTAPTASRVRALSDAGSALSGRMPGPPPHRPHAW